MGHLEETLEHLRRAYASGVASVRQARERARAEDAVSDAAEGESLVELEQALEAIDSTAPSPVPSRVQGQSSASGQAAARRHEPVVPQGLRYAASWAWRLLILAISGLCLLWVLARLETVVIPLLIALLLSALMSPLVTGLRRMHLPRSLATFLVMITGLLAVVGTLTLVINQFVDGAPELSAKAAGGAAQVQEWLRNGPLHLTEKQLSDLFSGGSRWVEQNRTLLTAGALSTASTLAQMLAGLFLVLFATFFFMRDGRRITMFLLGMAPAHARHSLASAADAAWRTLVSYVRATVVVAFIDALGIGLALMILRVPFAFSLAALVFLGAFIPIVGATVSGGVAVLVALVDRGPVVALILLAAVIAVQQLEGHVLQPFIMGRAVAIHPLAVILAIAAGLVLAGIIGALIAVPVVAVINTAVRHLIELRRADEVGG